MSKNRKKEKLENLFEAIENSVSKDANDAKEYLEEQEINHEDLVAENIKYIKQLQANLMLEKGASKQKWYKEKMKEFLQSFKINPDKIREELTQLQLKVNFRKLDVENLDEEELQKLIENANFLNYLDTKYADESDG